jgi:membrane protease YdiL (CAAX protease family)
MKNAIYWVIWNLAFSNLAIQVLPENVFRFAVGMWMPALSSVVFLKIEGAPIKPGINWRIGSAKSYLAAFFYALAAAIITVAIGLGTGYLKFSDEHGVGYLSAFLTLFVWIAASLGEEIGWRGYLHNHFAHLRHAPLLIGVVWGLWHFHDLISAKQAFGDLIVFTTMTILVSYFLSWLVRDGGSVLSCAFFHGIWNFFRLKILFGNPAQGTSGFFQSSNPRLTEMEGAFGLIAVILLAVPVLVLWYRRSPRKVLQ